MNDFMNKNMNNNNDSKFDSKFDNNFDSKFDNDFGSKYEAENAKNNVNAEYNASFSQENLDGDVQTDSPNADDADLFDNDSPYTDIIAQSREVVEPKKNKTANIIVMIGGIIFAIVGIFALYIGFSSLARQLSYEKVDATVISVRKFYSRDDDSTPYYVPTYEYYVDGVRYEAESSTGRSANEVPIVGTIETIYYNPENPEEIMSMGWTLIVFFVLGAVFISVGLLIFIQTLRGKWQWSSTSRRHIR